MLIAIRTTKFNKCQESFFRDLSLELTMLSSINSANEWRTFIARGSDAKTVCQTVTQSGT
jgi:hypothetical protein